MQGKRKKDEAVHAIRAALEALLDANDAYRAQLEGELKAAHAEPEPYGHLIRSLERQITHTRELEQAVEDQVWPHVISLANGSAYVEHTRTRDYF